MPKKFLSVLVLIFTATIVNGAARKSSVEQEIYPAQENYTEQENSTEKQSCFLSWLNWKTATGDWNGYRTQLENKGVTISSNFTTDLGGNPVGGLKKSASYAGFLDVAIALDFEKLVSFKGLALTISNYLASGKNLSNDIGNFFGVQEIYTPGNYFFGELDLSLALLNDQLVLEAGRLFAGDVFMTSELWQYYVSGGVNMNLNSVGSNIFFPEFNIAAWAARISYQPNKHWQLIGGIYNADTKVTDNNKHGLYFSFDMDNGYLALGQISYKNHQSREENGLPGKATFGGYYQSSKFPELTNANENHRGNYGLYFIFDQMLFRGDWPEFEGPQHLSSKATYADKAKHPYHQQTVVPKDRPKGLTLWGGAYLAPRESINTQIYQLAAGLLYQGLFPSRDLDVTAFEIILGKFSDRLAGQGTETVLELNHRVQLGPWLYITPDIQYVIKPNGQSNIPDALVLGVEASVNF